MKSNEQATALVAVLSFVQERIIRPRVRSSGIVSKTQVVGILQDAADPLKVTFEELLQSYSDRNGKSPADVKAALLKAVRDIGLWLDEWYVGNPVHDVGRLAIRANTADPSRPLLSLKAEAPPLDTPSLLNAVGAIPLAIDRMFRPIPELADRQVHQVNRSNAPSAATWLWDVMSAEVLAPLSVRELLVISACISDAAMKRLLDFARQHLNHGLRIWSYEEYLEPSQPPSPHWALAYLWNQLDLCEVESKGNIIRLQVVHELCMNANRWRGAWLDDIHKTPRRRQKVSWLKQVRDKFMYSAAPVIVLENCCVVEFPVNGGPHAFQVYQKSSLHGSETYESVRGSVNDSMRGWQRVLDLITVQPSEITGAEARNV